MMLLGLPALGWADGGATTSSTASDRPGGAAGEHAQRFVDDAVAATQATEGAVSPAWRDVERGLAAEYRPAIGEVTTQSVAQLLAAQYRAGLGGETKPSARGDSPYDQPALWRRTVVEVVVGAGGEIVASRVVTPSGNAQLDRKAATAAESTVRSRSALLHSPTKTRVRFAIEAGVSVVPPEAAGTAVPGTTRPNGGIVRLSRMHFDETTGKVSRPDYILQKKLHTRVSLIGIQIE